ncbi:MAG: hypothetical protein U1F98_09620 [Verrucomicrobiota bacterium]
MTLSGFSNRPRARLQFIAMAAGLAAALAVGAGVHAAPAATNLSSEFVLDMVYDNPGEPPQPTAFRDPRTLAQWGYNGQVIVAAADACETFDAIAPGLLNTNSPSRTWIENHARALETRARDIHAAGLQAYAWIQFILLPREIVARYRDRICDSQGRIDLEQPLTQQLVRAQVAELFDRCPSLDGIVVRTGEIYLHDTPFHTSKGRANEELIQAGTAILNGPQSHITLLRILRDEACVKRGKKVFYRTWDFGDNFHINPEYYLKVTDAIAPHTNLVFSIKPQAGDFLRMLPFNQTLGIGRHRQIVEVQCQREAYGKGAHPYYVGDGVINGWEEFAWIMKPGGARGLRDIAGNPRYAGVWTWSRGGGWAGPYLTNELWCALNLYVVSRYAENTNRTEREIFDEYAAAQLGLQGQDVDRFRELNLLSAAAVLRGQCSAHGWVDLWWARDDTLAEPDLRRFVRSNLVETVLAEKAESVRLWRQIESLAAQIQFTNTATREFVAVSSAYGRIKYSIIEQGWTILLLGGQGDSSGRYDCERISAAIARYDELWSEWRALKAAHACCPTLYRPVAFENKPGLGAAVDRYRKICAATADRNRGP